MIQRTVFFLTMAVLATACHFPWPTSPSEDAEPRAPVTLTGMITTPGPSGLPVKGATVKILDGFNQGSTAVSDARGAYKFDNLRSGNANIAATAPQMSEAVAGVFIDGPTTLHFELVPPSTWTAKGFGSDAFEMPFWVTRVRILASTSAACENFGVRVGDRAVVSNIILGTCQSGIPQYQGVHFVPGGPVEVLSPTGAVSWSFEWTR